jgi:hypothetical protein
MGVTLLLALPMRSARLNSSAVPVGKARAGESANGVATQNTSIASSTPDAGHVPGKNKMHASTDVRQATGVVIHSSCAAGLQLQLKTSSETLHLHARTGGYPEILTPSGKKVDSFPCKTLQGQRVTARYRMDDAKGERATVEMLQILASEDNEPEAGPQTPPSGNENAIPSGRNALLGAAPGDQTTAEGNVTEVTCNGNEMQIKIASAQGPLTLHARDYTRLSYDDDRSAFERSDLPACTELGGRYAEVTFIVVEHRHYDGEIQHVEIEK